MDDDALYKDPDYIQSKIDATLALLLALAQQLDKDAFRMDGLDALERLRVSTLNTPTSDTRLVAIEMAENWLKSRTA